jgi:hypothetical protein
LERPDGAPAAKTCQSNLNDNILIPEYNFVYGLHLNYRQESFHHTNKADGAEIVFKVMAGIDVELET